VNHKMALIPKIITDAASVVAFQNFLDKFEYKLSLYYHLLA